MPNFPALDVAIGLIFIFFILAIVCSGINEAFASAFRWRAQDLERGLWELLRDPDATGNATEALEKLKAHLTCPVRLWDERLTTVAAQRYLHDAGRNVKQSRSVIDQVAAQIILQGWLDAQAFAV